MDPPKTPTLYINLTLKSFKNQQVQLFYDQITHECWGEIWIFVEGFFLFHLSNWVSNAGVRLKFDDLALQNYLVFKMCKLVVE